MNLTEKISYQARQKFETGTISRELLIGLYKEYANVGDTLKFVEKTKVIFPNGNCGLASLYLKEKLGGKVVQGKYGKQNHTFLLVDETVIDITADQFGGPKVYMGPLRLPWSFRENKSS
jgi:hypothetical protein